MSGGRVQSSPLLMRGGLSDRVFVVTKWRDMGEGRVEALMKHDVTEQYDALRAEDAAKVDDAASS